MLALCAAAMVCLGVTAGVRTVNMDDGIPVREARFSAARESIDPNSASIASLRRLPGIGPTRATAIVEYRGKSGSTAFVYDEDLMNVSGIGAGTLYRVRPYLSLPRGGDLR